jgi:hypothetical protein
VHLAVAEAEAGVPWMRAGRSSRAREVGEVTDAAVVPAASTSTMACWAWPAGGKAGTLALTRASSPPTGTSATLVPRTAGRRRAHRRPTAGGPVAGSVAEFGVEAHLVAVEGVAVVGAEPDGAGVRLVGAWRVLRVCIRVTCLSRGAILRVRGLQRQSIGD